ncbi:MAG: hypothetical protein H0V07_00370 [Propionibacteriales bacterium]|nr:hypothetical protein [Propionibacteriales bacterium]
MNASSAQTTIGAGSDTVMFFMSDPQWQQQAEDELRQHGYSPVHGDAGTGQMLMLKHPKGHLRRMNRSSTPLTR